MAALIEATNVGIKLGTRSVLHGITMSIREGEIVTILGPNGSGKTTLLRTLTGAIEPTLGHLTRRDDLRIGYTPQRLAVDTTMPLTVERFLALVEKTTRHDRDVAMDRVGLESVKSQQLSSLSGGQFQRALLARAILRKPNS